jgi:phosphopantothenoylcysteine decarboxylase/phosphopantothenate--cysteine ligase
VVAANVALSTPAGVRRIDVETAAELAEATRREFADAHVLLMAAAVADFRPDRPEPGKIAREGRDGLELRLEPTEDVLAATTAGRRPDQVVVAFAAEHGADATERARAKLRRKGADAIVLNDVSREEIGFESEHNEVVVIDSEGSHPVPMGTKQDVADAILDLIRGDARLHLRRG